MNSEAPAVILESTALLEVDRLVKYFPIGGGFLPWRRQAFVHAVDEVSFSIEPSTTYSLVGESGSGKTTIGRLILRLETPTAGQIRFAGERVQGLRGRRLKAYRRRVQAVFQDPYGSLNPRMKVAAIVGELPALHQGLHGARLRERVQELLSVVGLSPSYASRYPHEFSGGQRQRIAIARAISLNPSLLVLDEPVSALDVSIRAQVLNLLSDIQRQFGLSYLLIAHDLAIVEHLSDRVGVLYLGKLVEECSGEELYCDPLHPYTKALLSAVPRPDPTQQMRALPLRGEIPSAIDPPSGCRFHTRCPLAIERCAREEPELRDHGAGHRVACHLVD